MIARVWRGWTAADFADEVAAHLAEVTLAGYASAPGNLSTQLLTRPSGGGVELMTVTLWDSKDVMPRRPEERHRLLVGGQTEPACWQVVGPAAAIARAA
jgi:hypothetical protein